MHEQEHDLEHACRRHDCDGNTGEFRRRPVVPSAFDPNYGQNDDENRLTSLAYRSLPGSAGEKEAAGLAGSPSPKRGETERELNHGF